MTLLRVSLPLCLVWSIFSFTPKNYLFTTLQKQTNVNEWAVDKIAGSVVEFKNGKKFKTNLYNLKYIGQVANGNKAPFLILSGRDCDECDANISLYIHSPSNGKLMVGNGENRYQFPGTERDLEDKKLLYKGRAFYGEVMPNINGVVWYQKELMEDGKWQKSLFLVNLNNGAKREVTLKNTGQIKDTLHLMAQGRCKEIKGMDYLSEP